MKSNHDDREGIGWVSPAGGEWKFDGTMWVSSEVTVTLPDQLFRLEEANIPSRLARLLVGRTVSVRPATRRFEFDDDWEPESELFTKTPVLFANPEDGKVWRFPRRWFGRAISEPPLDASYSGSQAALWTERLHLPSPWDLWEINIDMSRAVIGACGQEATVKVCGTPGKPIKVSWQDPSGALWRIPHDWRRRRIRLPGSDVLLSNEIDSEVARGYAGDEVSVNYHPGSRCCLPDAYRFRDCFGRRWAVKMSDCVLLGYGAKRRYRTKPGVRGNQPVR